VYNGASLKTWQEFFHPGSKIVGIDINPRCAESEDVARNIFVRIGGQQDEKLLRSVIKEFGKFDVIIDDGGHYSSHMIGSFNFLFAEGMPDRAVYLVEDTHAAYWSDFRDQSRSFIDFAKHLVDLMHDHYRQVEHERSFLADNGVPTFHVPAVTTMLDQVQFFDSIVVLHRNATRPLPVARHL
jgi:hypothetical protein